MKRLIFTVTTDLSYDQRMIRICTSLSNAGYDVLLLGRKLNNSIRLKEQPFKQHRLNCFFEKGKLFYIEYNIRLFFFLLFIKMDGICAIDLDTILPCYYISRIKKVIRIYDAHELFCEMKEIVTRPRIYRVWKWIERKTVPHFNFGYTVNEPIAEEYFKMYQRRFEVIRNISLYDENFIYPPKEKYILYQGAVNEGRSFETVIPAMNMVNAKLIICGDGNYMKQAKQLVEKENLGDKISFTGMLDPVKLKEYTAKAYIGINLIENNGINNYYSLANRFFDYVHAGVPQLCVSYPAYKVLNDEYHVALLVDDLQSKNIADNMNKLLDDTVLWERLYNNCKSAAKELNWQQEEKKLIAFYKNIFG